jgi:hypothetical protein
MDRSLVVHDPTAGSAAATAATAAAAAADLAGGDLIAQQSGTGASRQLAPTSSLRLPLQRAAATRWGWVGVGDETYIAMHSHNQSLSFKRW